MKRLMFQPRPVVLTDGRWRREPTRPAEHRPPEFADQFDYHTLLFDSFFSGPNEVLITAPPFFNLLPAIQAMEVVASPSHQRCAFQIRNVDRHSQIRIGVPEGTNRLSLRSEIGQFEIEPQENLSAFFADKRVIFTQSKNNRIEWIQDWIRYHRDIHGANAVLIYDNQSTTYSPEDLLTALGAISGIERLCIASWPFRYGPQGFDSISFWDSDFCQHGSWEHARWMFLRHARSAMNADVDELVVSEDGASAFETAERSWAGVVRYRGHWVHGFRDTGRVATDRAPVRFTDFDHHLWHRTGRRWGIVPVRENVCMPKWTVVPSRCPDGAQWAPHRIKGWVAGLPISRNFSYRHFREISNSWKGDRSAREVFNPDRYIYDRRVCANYARVNWAS